MNVIPTISFFLFELLFRRYKANHLGVSSLAALSSNSFSKEKVAFRKIQHGFSCACFYNARPLTIIRTLIFPLVVRGDLHPGESALGSIGCEFEYRVTSPHKKIARRVKVNVVRTEPRREGAVASIGAKFEDGMAVLFRQKEIARSVNCQAPRGAKPGGKRTFRSLGREFEDRAFNIVANNKIAPVVKGRAVVAGEPGGT